MIFLLVANESESVLSDNSLIASAMLWYMNSTVDHLTILATPYWR